LDWVHSPGSPIMNGYMGFTNPRPARRTPAAEDPSPSLLPTLYAPTPAGYQRYSVPVFRNKVSCRSKPGRSVIMRKSTNCTPTNPSTPPSWHHLALNNSRCKSTRVCASLRSALSDGTAHYQYNSWGYSLSIRVG